MNRLARHQRGASIWLILMFVIVLGFGGIFGLKLIPLYLEWFKVEKAVNGTLQAGVADQTPRDIQATVIRRMDIDDVRRFTAVNFAEYFTIIKKGNKVTIDVSYEAVEPLFYNIYVLVKFENSYSN